MKLKFFGEVVAMLFIVAGLFMIISTGLRAIISSTTVHAANRPRFERIIEEVTGDDNFVQYCQRLYSACGTLIYGDEKGTRSTRLLCPKCHAELAILERETCPKQP